MVDSPRLAEVVWRVLPLAPARVLRHCPRCEEARAFAPTDKFRLNAQQRRIDVWLLYDCTACGATWKREILARRRPEEIGADLYGRLLRNDAATARAYARVVDGLALAGGGEARVERPDPIAPPCRIVLAVPDPVPVRLERILAAELGVSRARLRRRLDAGHLVLDGGERALRRPPRDGQVVVIGSEGGGHG